MPNLAGQHERQPEASRSLPLSLKPTPTNNPSSPQPAPFSEADALEQPNTPDCGTFFLWVPSAALPLIRPSPFRPSRRRTISVTPFHPSRRRTSREKGGGSRRLEASAADLEAGAKRQKVGTTYLVGTAASLRDLYGPKRKRSAMYGPMYGRIAVLFVEIYIYTWKLFYHTE
jgi:hypothetical protein